MYSFFPQTIRDWNDLPESLISSSELSDDSVSKFTPLVELGTNFSQSQPLVKDCQFGVSPVNYSDSESFLTIHIYTPGIYAEGYIVFVFPFVRSYVRSFVRSFVLPSVAWNLRQSFALKFLKWCISQQLLIRKHSYLDHS